MAPTLSPGVHQASLAVTFGCSYLPDATTFVSAYSDGQLALHAPNLPEPTGDAEDALPLEPASVPSRQFSWEAHSRAAYCVRVLDVAGKTIIISGGDATVAVWDYEEVVACSEQHIGGDITAAVTPRTVLTPSTNQSGDRPAAGGSSAPETNAVAWLPQGGGLAAAHGDGQVAVYSLETGQRTASLAGHPGGSMTVVATKSNTLVSGGDDSVVRMWDVRTQKAVRSFLPFTGESTATGTMKASGALPLVNCLDVDPSETWMVCGGTCHYLTLWHLGSGTLTAALPTAAPVQCALFDDTQIVSGGSEGYVSFWSHNGKLVARPPTECPSVYTLASNAACSTPVPMPKALLAGGQGPAIDVFGEWNRKWATVG